MFCEKCGAKLDDSEKFCHVCGAPTDEDEDDLIASDNMSQPQGSAESEPGSFLNSGQYNSNPAQGDPAQTGSWQSFNTQQTQNSQQIYNSQQGFNPQQSYNLQQGFNSQQGYSPQQNINPQGSPHKPNPYGMRPTISAKPVVSIKLLPLIGLGAVVVIAAIFMLFTGGKKDPVESSASSVIDSVSVQKVSESSDTVIEFPNTEDSNLVTEGSKGGSDLESEKNSNVSEAAPETSGDSSDKSLSSESSSSSDKSSSDKIDSGTSDSSYSNSSSESNNSSGSSNTGRYSNLSSTDRPKMSEFKWWYDDGVLQNGIPEEVRWLNASEYQGSWKGFIVYDVEKKYNSYMEELVNFDVEVTTKGVTLTVDWYMSRIDGETVDEENMADSTFTGYEYGEGIYVTDAGNITIDNFYELDGKQYAIGHLTAQDGTEAEIAMMRP
ncbi:MAG: zinc ribbon domain-containing protein [Oribacterium sp.]|nr:zinc ribbon domain-containing protein [Oribacterium sp.]MBP3802678.1 zinc ribbon domain-containing protein [Oribacterium sp.]